jgi:hypothetical protein
MRIGSRHHEEMAEVRPLDWSTTARPLKAASLALLVWSLLYAFPHLYWGLGGTGGLSMLKPSAREGANFEAANIFAFFFIGLAGFLGLALSRLQDARPLRLALVAILGAGAAVALSHGAYGVVFRIEQATGLREIDGVPFDRGVHGWVLWDLFVIEPWFFVEGILLWLTGYFALRTALERKRWLAATGVLTLFVFITAAAGLKTG